MNTNPFASMYYEAAEKAVPLELPTTAWPPKDALIRYEPKSNQIKLMTKTGIGLHSEEQFAKSCDCRPLSQSSWLFSALKRTSASLKWRIVTHRLDDESSSGAAATNGNGK